MLVLSVVVYNAFTSLYRPYRNFRIIATVEPSGDLVEKITLPVNTENAVLSARKYAATVTITVEGTGKISDTVYHTAFWKYQTGKLGQSFYGFQIDGSSPILRVFTTFPSAIQGYENRYQFLYPVGETLRPISFQMVNGNPSDTSEFLVEISIENLVGASDR